MGPDSVRIRLRALSKLPMSSSPPGRFSDRSSPPGYALEFSCLRVNAFDEKGHPVHQRGVSAVPGLYFLGLAWLSRRASPFIWGVWHDAEYLAGHISARNGSLVANASLQ